MDFPVDLSVGIGIVVYALHYVTIMGISMYDLLRYSFGFAIAVYLFWYVVEHWRPS